MIPEGHAGSPAPRSRTDASAKSIKNHSKLSENNENHQNALQNQGKQKECEKQR